MGNQETLTVTSRNDGLQLSVLYMEPEHTVCKGIVQIVHGMSEYKERYIPFMEFLADKGYASIIHDHRGHGQSVKAVEDYGYMYEVGADGFLDDILQVTALAKEKKTEVPVILLGHSMGSLAARCLMKKHDCAVDGLILSGAPCKNPAVGVAKLLAAFQKRLFGPRHVAKLMGVLCFAEYSGRFAKEGSSFAWINSDPEQVAAYDADPACGFVFTIDGFQILFALLEQTFRKDGWKCSKPGLPILFAAGEDDPCIGNNDKFKEEVDFMGMVGYQNVESRLYEGMRHEILNEPCRQIVYEDILGYLEKNFGGRKV